MTGTLSLDVAALHPLLDQSPGGLPRQFLASLQHDSPVISQPKVQTYPDVTYHTFPTLGLSLTYIPTPSTSDLTLDRIDIANPPHPPPQPTRKRPFPSQPFPKPLHLLFPTTTLTLPPINDQPSQTVSRPKRFDIQRSTTGREFVDVLGEPSKKGGGEGWMGVWLEWGCVELEVDGSEKGDGEGEKEIVRVGLMVELRDGGKELDEEDMKKGMGGVWDKAAKWEWAGLKIFRAEGTTQASGPPEIKHGERRAEEP